MMSDEVSLEANCRLRLHAWASYVVLRMAGVRSEHCDDNNDQEYDEHIGSLSYLLGDVAELLHHRARLFRLVAFFETHAGRSCKKHE